MHVSIVVRMYMLLDRDRAHVMGGQVESENEWVRIEYSEGECVVKVQIPVNE